MNFAELLLGRMSEVEKIRLRMAASEDALISKYWDYHNELSGSKFRGGTYEEGVEEIRWVRRRLWERFEAASADWLPVKNMGALIAPYVGP